MNNNRRSFLQMLTAAFGTAAAFNLFSEASANSDPVKPVHDMSNMPADWTRKEQIAMVMYPGFTAQDLVGPQYMFANLMGASVHLVAETMDPVMSDTGMAIMPTRTFKNCPNDLDIVFVPGGGDGTLKALKNTRLIDFVSTHGQSAKWITSVCTGSLILAKAGLLDGYQATSHWVVRDLLAKAGAIPVNKRVVIDRNRVTGAGVTAGIDFGLSMVAMLRNQIYAETVQLLAEYAPEPPFNAGTPETAPVAAVEMMHEMFTGFMEQASVLLLSGAKS
jgi:cyclohexyl-isocyanide hydratase